MTLCLDIFSLLVVIFVDESDSTHHVSNAHFISPALIHGATSTFTTFPDLPISYLAVLDLLLVSLRLVEVNLAAPFGPRYRPPLPAIIALCLGLHIIAPYMAYLRRTFLFHTPPWACFV